MKTIFSISMVQGMTVDELNAKLCNNKGPKVQATEPEYVKFHDDKVTLHRGQLLLGYMSWEVVCQERKAACMAAVGDRRRAVLQLI